MFVHCVSDAAAAVGYIDAWLHTYAKTHKGRQNSEGKRHAALNQCQSRLISSGSSHAESFRIRDPCVVCCKTRHSCNASAALFSLWMYRNTISELMNVSVLSRRSLRQSDKIEDASIHSLSASPLRYLVKKSIKRKQRQGGWILFPACFAGLKERPSTAHYESMEKC